MKKYYWLEGFDGGKGSDPFDTEEEAKAMAYEVAKGERFTQHELENLIKKCENYIFVGYIDFPDDADEDDFKNMNGEFFQTDVVELNENTLNRIY